MRIQTNLYNELYTLQSLIEELDTDFQINYHPNERSWQVGIYLISLSAETELSCSSTKSLDDAIIDLINLINKNKLVFDKRTNKFFKLAEDISLSLFWARDIISAHYILKNKHYGRGY